MKLIFENGAVYENEAKVSVYDAAASLGLMSREVIAAEVGGKDCMCANIDMTDSDTFIWLLKEFDVPYIKID